MFEKVLNMPLVLISTGFWLCFWFWMCQSFGDTRVLYMPLDLNMQRFWIYQSSEYRVQNMHKYFLIIPEYAWFCLHISEYAETCVNMPKTARMLLFYIFPVVTLHYTWLLIWRSTGDKIWICCYLSEPRGRGIGDRESWCTFLVFFFLSQNFWRNRVKFISYL